MVYIPYIMRRTQVYLDPRQTDELARRAASRGTTTSKMIREAIDRYLADPADEDEALRRFRAAVTESFGSAPYLAEGSAYVEGLRQVDDARDAELDSAR
jgi:hypothetical protein